MKMAKPLLTILAFFQIIYLTTCQTDKPCPEKYSILDPSRQTCIPCKVCPIGFEKSTSSSPICKRFYPKEIPNQGFPHCLNVYYQRPSCPAWEVQNGKPKCSDTFSIYSKCSLVCNPGYSVVDDAEMRCLEELHWNIGENTRPWCKRRGIPGVPAIKSTSVRSQVRPDTDVTLTCANSTELVGVTNYFWYFKNQKLENNKSSKTLIIMTVKKEDEGVYRCSVQDENGMSQISSDYSLEVENYQGPDKEFNWYILVVCTILAMAALFVLFVTVRYRSVLSKFWWKKCQKKKIFPDQRRNGENDSLVGEIPAVPDKCWETATIDETSPKDHRSSEDKPFLTSIDTPAYSTQETKVYDFLTETPLLYSQNSSGNQLSLISPYSPHSVFTIENELQASHSPSQNHSSSASSSLYGVANNDQKVFIKLLKTKKIVDQIVTCLDQKPDVNRNHPTFKDLGRFLHLPEDKINHIEYYCSQHKISPTQELLHIMKSEGRGLNLLMEFLRSHHCSDLIGFIQREINGP